MNVYELVFLVGSDLSSTKVDDIVRALADSLEKSDCSILLKEYWGIRELEYSINNRSRAHYYYMAMEFKDNEKKAKWIQSDLKKLIVGNHIVIRHMFSKAKFFKNDPSPIMKLGSGLDDKNLDVVDVTNFGTSNSVRSVQDISNAGVTSEYVSKN